MMIRFNNTASSSMNNSPINLTPTKKKYRKKPDPTAPKITRPCTECGKKFWSWKALFGHMRCHPERQWRGINPPSNHKQKEIASSVTVASTSKPSYSFSRFTEDDHDAALSLLMLANGFGIANCSDQSPKITTSENVVYVREGVVMSGSGRGGDVEVVPGSGGGSNFRFECSSCKKVFGSHQALGGHRASHKNVKGCFANTRNIDGVFLEEELSQNCDGGIVVEDDNDDKMLMLGLGSGIQVPQYHQCNICFRVFPSGQALGGHKRCHWEKFDDANNNNEGLRIDLNMPAPPPASALAPPPTPPTPRIFEGGSSHYLHALSLEALDLRLGL